MSTPGEVPFKKLILVPALITLAVTLFRLIGELRNWSPAFFSREGGGAGAIVGIVWLVPVFGIYFALKLAAEGNRPAKVGPAIGYPLLGLALLPAVGFIADKAGASEQSLATLAFYIAFSILGGAIAFRGWPALGWTLVAYGLAARIPVVVVMLFAILGNWGTHYDVTPPNLPAMGALTKWLVIGVVPQLTIWIWFTITVGAFLGAVVVAATGRARRPSAE